jgi:hypothetical protein
LKPGQFFRLIRVPTLAATAVPMMVGGALALDDGLFSPLSWLDILLVGLLMQIATNALNEYGDYRHAVDTVPSAGFAGIIVSGEVRASEVLYTAAACYALPSASESRLSSKGGSGYSSSASSRSSRASCTQRGRSPSLPPPSARCSSASSWDR